MKYIKKFEELDFNQTLPITSVNNLTNYYSCDECNAIWREFNETSKKCKYCGSDEIEEISEEEWYELTKSRLDEDEIEDLEKEKDQKRNSFVNLASLKNKKKYVN